MLGFNLFLFSGGRSYEYDRIREWLDDAGFPECRREGLRQPGFSLLIAREAEPRPAAAEALRLTRSFYVREGSQENSSWLGYDIFLFLRPEVSDA